jgi:Mg2+ and Co2+ transporter CorA
VKDTSIYTAREYEILRGERDHWRQQAEGRRQEVEALTAQLEAARRNESELGSILRNRDYWHRRADERLEERNRAWVRSRRLLDQLNEVTNELIDKKNEIEAMKRDIQPEISRRDIQEAKKEIDTLVRQLERRLDRLEPSLQESTVSLTDDDWNRILWWLNTPTPPGKAKEMDIRIINKIRNQRGEQVDSF